MSKLYLYYDMLSQPSRALYTFLKVTDIPFVPCKTTIMSGDNKTPEFAKINPRKKLPALIDGDFCLSESIAVFRYIAEKYQHKIADHWYPRDLKKRARVDEYLEYQHNGTRLHYSYFFMNKIMQIAMVGHEPLEGFPKLSVWLERVSQELNPPFAETIEELYSHAGKEVPQKYQRVP